LFGVNNPVPEVLHIAPPISTDPLRVAAPPEQIVWSAPAFTIGSAAKAITTLSLNEGHGAIPVAVSDKITLPAAISAAEAIYEAFKVMASGAKLPDPVVLHVIPELLVEVPFNIALLLAQMV